MQIFEINNFVYQFRNIFDMYEFIIVYRIEKFNVNRILFELLKNIKNAQNDVLFILL